MHPFLALFFFFLFSLQISLPSTCHEYESPCIFIHLLLMLTSEFCVCISLPSRDHYTHHFTSIVFCEFDRHAGSHTFASFEHLSQYVLCIFSLYTVFFLIQRILDSRVTVLWMRYFCAMFRFVYQRKLRLHTSC